MLLNHIYDGQVLSSRPNEIETQPRAEPEAEAEGTGGRQDTRAASALCSEVHLKDFLFDFPLLLLLRNDDKLKLKRQPGQICSPSVFCPFKMFFFSNDLSAWRILLISFLHAP